MTVMKNLIVRLWQWVFGPHPQGVGTLLLGIAALSALWQTSSLLDRVLQIQKQAEQIDAAVTELKTQSHQISSAIDLLGSQLKELKENQAVESSPALQAPSPTREQIKEAIKTIPQMPSTNRSTIYLPSDKIDSTVDMIYEAKTPAARAAILQNSLEYKTFSPSLLNGNGEPGTK